MRVPMLTANWKMNKTIGDALEFAGGFLPLLQDAEWPEIAVCPPFTAIPAMSAVLAGHPVSVGAQDVFWEERGAFTGEVSASMLKDAGCSYVIVGHSERRHLLGETDEMVQKKLRAVLDHGMKPILCVGETIDERENGQTYQVCETMTREGLGKVKAEELASVVIAYEPVWAIGTGKEAKPDDAADVVNRVRAAVDSVFGAGASQEMRVLYGGSVKSGNIRSFMAKPEIDGALVGGASLDPAEFARLAAEVRKGRPSA